MGRPRGRDRQPAPRPQAGRRHGLPALLAVRADVGAGERGAGHRGCRKPQDAGQSHPRGQRGLWPAARPREARLRAVGRRAPAHRDRALPAAEPAPADHGRADLGADAAGGRPAVPDAAHARGRGLLDPLHQPQARGGPGPLLEGDDPAPRQGRGERRPAGRDRAGPRPDDDRHAAQAGEPGPRGSRDGQGAPGRPGPQP